MTAIEAPTTVDLNAAQTGPLRLPPVKPTEAKAAPKAEVKEPTAEEKALEAETMERVGKKMFRGMPRTKETKTETEDEKKERETKASEAKKAKEKEAAGKLTDQEKAEKEKADKLKKTALKPVVKAPAKPDVDIEKLVTSTVAATAKALHKEPVAAKEEAAEEVSAARRDEWKAIQQAEAAGTTHKGAAQSALKVFKAEQSYIEAWQKENPGQKYNPNSNEHDAWYEKNLPPWMEEAAERGAQLAKDEAIEARVREKLAKEHEPLKEKLAKLELLNTERNVREVAPRQINQGIGAAIHALNPELVNLKEGQTIEAVDPVAHQVMLRAGPQIAHETHAALMLFASRGESLPDGDPMRGKIIGAAVAMEKEISEASEADRTASDGRTFVGLNEWAGLTEAEQAKHWTVTGEMVAMKLASGIAREAKAIYDQENDRMEKLAEARGWKKADSTNGSKPASDGISSEDNEDAGKPRSPSTAATTVIKPGAGGEAKTAANGADRLMAKIFRR